MWNKIVHPISGIKLDIDSKKGQQLLKNYCNYLSLTQQKGGANSKNITKINELKGFKDDSFKFDSFDKSTKTMLFVKK